MARPTKDDAYAKIDLLKSAGLSSETILNDVMQALTTDEANSVLDYILKVRDLNDIL